MLSSGKVKLHSSINPMVKYAKFKLLICSIVLSIITKISKIVDTIQRKDYYINTFTISLILSTLWKEWEKVKS